MQKQHISSYFNTALMAFILINALSILGCNNSDSTDNATKAQTQFGYVSGYISDNTMIWQGIPYAKPPVGSLRWQAPVDPAPWKGIRDATAPCSECTQQLMDEFWKPISDDFVGSENCLYLNIYRPVTNIKDRLPVVVWIHGGGNRIGSAEAYDASILAKNGNMVVVVIQYRLGTLGWLTNPALRASGSTLDQSGNYGLLDQMKALSWVENNITAFGGDADRVTISGQSAGAHAVMNLIISPQSNNFQRAVAISPALNNIMPLRTSVAGDTESNEIIDWLLVDDGTCDDAGVAATYRGIMTSEEITNYLRGKAATKILQATIGAGINTMPASFMDGVVMPTSSWLDSIEAGNFKKVPLILGSTQYEYKDLMTLYFGLLKAYAGVPSGPYTWENVYDVLNGTLTLDEVLPTDQDKVAYEQSGLLKSRKWQAELAAIASAITDNDSATPVYNYYFTWAGGGDPALENFRKIFGASHTQDLPFWFGSLSDLWGYSFTDVNQVGQDALEKAMMAYLCSFANTGDPNPSESLLPTWTQWSNTSGDSKYITFDADLDQYQISMDTTEVTDTIVTGEIATVLGSNPSLGTLFYLLGIWPY
ncbi:MAG: carboxylesterase family protein [Proteobacteria bacterium]|nr:carboxylesterase family protein [Pseudomonadota bacterium]